MKILCVSDCLDPLVYSQNIKEHFGDVELVLAAGDIPLEYLEFLASSLNKPVYFVFGNHNLEGFVRYSKQKYTDIGAVHIGGKIAKEKELIIAGLGGCALYNYGKNQWTERGMTFQILRLLPLLLFNRVRYGRCLDILLTHASPRGIHDRPDLCHKGFKCFLDFMRIFKPKYLVHGHTHIYDNREPRSTRYAATRVVNAYSHAVIEV